MLKGLYILNEGAFNKIYSEEDKKQISKHVDIYAPPQLWDNTKDSNWLKRENPEVLHDLEVMFSGWGAPVMDKEFLDAAPNLKMVFYGAGSIKGIVTDEFWDRDIRITSAYAANAVPVAEYTLSQIIFSLKRGWFFALHTERNGEFPDYKEKNKIPGAYGTTVGIISLGMIGSYVCELLKSFDVNVIAYDPYCSEEKAAKLDVELCSLDDVFGRSNVVSLHTPWLKETEGMIKGKHFEMMKSKSAFINTARGAVVREKEMIEVLQERTDLWAVLDVTHPEPPKPDSPLYNLPNVVLTPHIAGSMAQECNRMGNYMVQELNKYLNDEPLQWEITEEKAKILA